MAYGVANIAQGAVNTAWIATNTHGVANTHGEADTCGAANKCGVANMYSVAKTYSAAETCSTADTCGAANTCGMANTFGMANTCSEADMHLSPTNNAHGAAYTKIFYLEVYGAFVNCDLSDQHEILLDSSLKCCHPWM